MFSVFSTACHTLEKLSGTRGLHTVARVLASDESRCRASKGCWRCQGIDIASRIAVAAKSTGHFRGVYSRPVPYSEDEIYCHGSIQLGGTMSNYRWHRYTVTKSFDRIRSG